MVNPMRTQHLSILLLTLTVSCIEPDVGPSTEGHTDAAHGDGDGGLDGGPHPDDGGDASVLPDGCVPLACTGLGMEHFNREMCRCEPCDAPSECGQDSPVCFEGHGCVECTHEDPSFCTAQNKVCNSDDSNTCVQCNLSEDCKDPANPVCNDHVCEPCKEDSECSTRGSICDEAGPLKGQCVKCTADADDELRCGAFSCDPAIGTCTETTRGTVKICEPCVADSECMASHKCIPLFFGENMEPQGGFCMKVAESGCSLPYGATPISRESLSGATTAAYCGINEKLTSCSAITALDSGKDCANGDDSLCDARGARCEAVNNIADRCTYSCEFAGECPSGAQCRGPDGEKYCGGPI